MADVSLPLQVTSQSDLGRMYRELLAIDEYMKQSALRTPGTLPSALPRISKALQVLSTSSEMNLLDSDNRQKLIDYISAIYHRPITIHMSFAAEPSPAFIQKLISWLRSSIHPQILLQVGLQPDIAAGCTVRTTNQYFDLSLRKDLARHREELVGLIRGALTETEVSAQTQGVVDKVTT